MSGLRSAIEELANEDLAVRTHDELSADVAEISSAIDRLTAQLLRRVGEADKRKGYVVDGFLNTTSWLSTTADLSRSEAKRILVWAHTAERIPETASRMETGDLSRSRYGILSRAADRHPDSFERDADMLLGFADDLPLSDMTKAVRYWSNVVDDTADLDFAQQRERAYLHASRLSDGRVKVDALLDQESGEYLLTALHAATPPRSPDDLRPAPNRRVEALVTICDQWLANGTTTSGGVKPHVSLIVDLDTLKGRTGNWCHLSHTGPITRETARRILCDSDVTRVITKGRSQILDMGRAVRTASPAQRKALEVIYGGCAVTGCEKPISWCDIHHLKDWIEGGETNLSDLIPGCRPHHIMFHNGTLNPYDFIRPPP